MPAYRSAAEAEIRDAVVAHLRRERPEARLIHEINVCEFGNRVDVLAVSPEEVVAVEIKSERDKLDRLPTQVRAMQGAAQRVRCALHAKFRIRREEYGAVWHQDPPEARGASVWYWPGHLGWKCAPRRDAVPLPGTAIHMLWRNELYEMCGALRIGVGPRATKPFMVVQLQWLCTGRELTHGICAALRRRDCIEADPPIENVAEHGEPDR